MATVLRVDGPVIIDWGNGVRIQLSPMGVQAAAPSPSAPRGRAGRPPSPATAKLRDAMQSDAAGRGPRNRAEYLQILHDAGGPKSGNAAGIIVNREAKRAFGKPLRRGKKGQPNRGKGRRGGGRQPSPATAVLREKLQKDKAAGELRDPPHYVRWVVDQPGVKIGLKAARPIVYRELGMVRKA